MFDRKQCDLTGMFSVIGTGEIREKCARDAFSNEFKLLFFLILCLLLFDLIKTA